MPVVSVFCVVKLEQVKPEVNSTHFTQTTASKEGEVMSAWLFLANECKAEYLPFLDSLFCQFLTYCIFLSI